MSRALRLQRQLSTIEANAKPGMTRAELRKVLVEDGGFSSRLRQTFVLRECQFVKVNVEFEEVPGPTGGDRVVSVSKPYLESPRFD